MSNYDLRKNARAGEVEALKNAKVDGFSFRLCFVPTVVWMSVFSMEDPEKSRSPGCH